MHLFLAFAECSYYACIAVMILTPILLLFWVCRAVVRCLRPAPIARTHEADPNRARARRTASAFQRIVNKEHEVAWRGAHIIAKWERRKPRVLKPRRRLRRRRITLRVR
jgi:hypothetical protein